MPTMSTDGTAAHRRLSVLVTSLCWTMVFLDGIDFFIYGAVTPLMTEDAAFGFTPADIGTMGSLATFGMLIGAVTAGTVTDMIGRRKVLVIGVTVFSLASAACALAPTVELFGAARFVAGLGLGGLLPTAIAMAMEFAPAARRNIAVTVTMTAHQAGGVIAALLGITVATELGWRSVFWIGAAPLVLILPILLKILPESPAYLIAKGKTAQAESMLSGHGVPIAFFETEKQAAGRKGGVRDLFARPVWSSTIMLWITTFFGLMLVYGFSVWLPKLMGENGYDLGASIAFLLVINLGGIVGMLVAGTLADKFSARGIAILWFVVTCGGLAIFSLQMPLALTYTVAFITGACLFSAQTLVYAATGAVFPASSRATAIGWVAGVGRWGAVFGPIFGTFLYETGNVKLPFFGFAAAAGLAALSLSAVRAKPVAAMLPTKAAPAAEKV